MKSQYESYYYIISMIEYKKKIYSTAIRSTLSQNVCETLKIKMVEF
jgi:hypothetical protein